MYCNIVRRTNISGLITNIGNDSYEIGPGFPRVKSGVFFNIDTIRNTKFTKYFYEGTHGI